MTLYIQDPNGKMAGSLPTPVPAPTAARPVPAASSAAPAADTSLDVDRAHARFTSSRSSAAPSLSRAEGYRRGAPKEEAGLACVENFLSRLLATPAETITRVEGADANFRTGDLRLPSGKTIEVKRQPIDPDRYPLNFVEVAELTFNPRHAGGASTLARALDIPTDRLAQARVRDYRVDGRPSNPLGLPDHVSVSITSMLGSAATVYTNPDAGHLYIYRRDEIVDHIRRAVLNDNVRRGQGNSNDDGLAVMVPLPRWRFTRGRDGLWRYTGTGSAEAEKHAIRAHLS